VGSSPIISTSLFDRIYRIIRIFNISHRPTQTDTDGLFNIPASREFKINES
jgi:hypothetical protein